MYAPTPSDPSDPHCPHTPGRQRGGAINAIRGAPISAIVYAHLDVSLPPNVMETEELANVYVATARSLASGEDPAQACSEGLAELLEAAYREDYASVLSDLADTAEVVRSEIDSGDGPVTELIARVSNIASDSEDALNDAVFSMLDDIVQGCSDLERDPDVEIESIEGVITDAMLAQVAPKRSLTRMYIARMVVWFVVFVAIEGSYVSNDYDESGGDSGSESGSEDYDMQETFSGGSRAQGRFTAPIAMTALAAALTLASSLR